jgi:aspartate racemase
MKTLGLIGGMSWESTALYYAALNRGVAARLGGLHSAKLLIGSVDFAEVVALQKADDWEGAGALLAGVARGLEAGGADVLALAVNTMHKVAPAVRAATSLPLVDIRTVVADAVRARGLRRVALLGTRYVVEQAFYAGPLSAEGGCAVMRGTPEDRSLVHDAIYGELSLGVVRDDTRKAVADILTRMQADGAEGAVLACTELPMLELQALVPSMPLLDSTALHAEACVEAMLG